MTLPILPALPEAYADEAAVIRALAADAARNPADYPARRPARLLLLGCSATKAETAEALPPRALYRGPLWLTLGAADPEAALAQAIAVSAAHGFIGEAVRIRPYEARLTADAGAAVAAEILAPSTRIICPRGDRAERQAAMQRAARSALSALRDAWRAAGCRPLEAVALCGGAAYLAPMRAAVALGRALGLIAAAAEIREINATIGVMRRELRAWLEGEAAPATVAPAAAPLELEEPPPAETPIAAAATAEAPHLAGLRAALARLERRLAELDASADAEAERSADQWRRAQRDWTRRFKPSSLSRCPRDRSALEAAHAAAREAADGRRAGQVATLEAKRRRILAAIAAAEATAARRAAAIPPPRLGHNGGPEFTLAEILA